MKRKLLVGLGVILAFGITAQAQAVQFYSGTVASWATDNPVTDADLDTQWTLTNYDPTLDPTLFTMAEEDLGGVDYYTLAMDFSSFGGILDASYSLEYTGVSLSDEYFASAHLDSTHVNTGTTVTKEVYDGITGALLLTLTSSDGVPTQGVFAPTKSIRVVETYSAGPNGRLDSSTNTFDVRHVPAPLTPALLGLGLVGLGWSRRRKAK